MHPASAVIPADRLDDYAATGETFGDMDTLLMTISQIRADQVTLKAEGRTHAGRGAARLLATMVRRLCATQATSEAAAAVKIDMLVAVGQDYRANGAGLLMAAMVDTAIGLETEMWLSARH